MSIGLTQSVALLGITGSLVEIEVFALVLTRCSAARVTRSCAGSDNELQRDLAQSKSHSIDVACLVTEERF